MYLNGHINLKEKEQILKHEKEIIELRKQSDIKLMERLDNEASGLKPLLLELAKLQIETVKKENKLREEMLEIVDKMKDKNLRYVIYGKISESFKETYRLDKQFYLPELKPGKNSREFYIEEKK